MEQQSVFDQFNTFMALTQGAAQQNGGSTCDADELKMFAWDNDV